MDYQKIIDKYYPAGSPLRDIYIKHCSQVAMLALDINKNLPNQLSEEDVMAAAMLHDIGIVRCDAPSIECHGDAPYITHGIIGAEMLRSEGVDEKIARVAELHTGAGLTVDDIERQKLPLPKRDYLPESTLERLVCYADKFFSKSGDMKRKDMERVRASMARHGEDTLRRFDDLATEFPLPKSQGSNS